MEKITTEDINNFCDDLSSALMLKACQDEEFRGMTCGDMQDAQPKINARLRLEVFRWLDAKGLVTSMKEIEK